jgi:hypothetical protein
LSDIVLDGVLHHDRAGTERVGLRPIGLFSTVLLHDGRRVLRRLTAAMALLMATPLLGGTLPPPAATVGRHDIRLAGPPAMRVRVPGSARYVGGDRFVLYDIADCELHLFVDAGPDKRVRRYWWVQREAYLPARPDLTHDYASTGDRRETHWGLGVWVHPSLDRTDAPETPGSDGAQIRALLAKAGYTLPPALASVRLVHLLDEPGASGHGTRELMIIYAEDTASSGLRAGDVQQGADTRRAPMAEALVRRAVGSVGVEVR